MGHRFDPHRLALVEVLGVFKYVRDFHAELREVAKPLVDRNPESHGLQYLECTTIEERGGIVLVYEDDTGKETFFPVLYDKQTKSVNVYILKEGGAQ